MDRIQLGSAAPVGKARGNRTSANRPSDRGVEKNLDFSKVLDGKFQGKEVKFSAHAQDRLKARNIRLSPTDMSKINDAVSKAAGKGAKETLVLVDRTAFVVSVVNRTVITAMDETQMKENVFTNIDSAVIL